MSPQQIEKALYKLIDNLLIKGKTKFRVEVAEHILPDWIGGVTYKIRVYLTNDHSKYWNSSPNFSPDYSNFIDSLQMEFEDGVFSLIKYLSISESPFIRTFWEHYNTDTYEPLLNALGEMGIPYKVNFGPFKPFAEIILDEDFPSDVSEVQKELNDSFSLDNILIYFGDLNSI